MSENGTSWASVIPGFFYELIGRIIPGGTFILGLIYTFAQPFLCDVILKQKKDGSSVELPYIVIFIVFLGLSYSAGFLLTPLGHKLGNQFYKSQYEKKFKIEKLKKHSIWLYENAFPNEKKSQNGNELPSIKKLSDEEFEWLFQCHHNLAKDGYPKQSRSLSKSAADVQLCINTSAAFLIIGIVPLFKLVSHLLGGDSLKENTSLNLAVALLIAVVFYWAAYYRNDRFLSRQFSFSREAYKLKIEKGGLYEY